MKVYIGPYRKWIGPYQIADTLMFWSKDRDRKHRFGEWLATNKDGSFSRLNKFCNWIHEKNTRKVKVRIDDYDTWNTDSTLALIIAPVLRNLREDKMGTPFTDREDAPADAIYDDLPEENEYSKGYSETRWKYILDEMIFAFESKTSNEDWDMEIWEKYNREWCVEAMDERGAIDARIKNGFRLFGKYYQSLWT